MKKCISIFLVLIWSGLFMLKAQEERQIKVSWGVKAENNWSGFILASMPEGESKMKTGFTGGGFLNLDISEHFALQGELLFHYKSSELRRENEEGKFRYWGNEIPVYAIYKINLANHARAYIGAGPYTEFGFSAKLKREGSTVNLYDKDTETNMHYMRDTNTGVGIIWGYEFASGIQINMSYKISITNVTDDNITPAKLYPMALGIGVGYRFGR